jgi:hypothetical protein
VDEDSTIIRRRAEGDRAEPEPLAHVVVVIEPDGRQRRLWLGQAGLRVGRTPGNDLVLADPEVSRQHCVIEISGESAVVSDPGSTNGTFVSGRRISGSAPLRHGETLRIVHWTLRYECGTRAEMERAAEIDRELERAGAYIRGLLPEPIAEGPVRADWRFLPCARIGGDAFGYRFLTPDHFAVFLLDVAGHGAGSALLAATVMNRLRERARSATNLAEAEPAAVLAGLNDAFGMEEQGGLFFSAWYGLYEISRRRLAYASAGHHPAFLRRSPEAAPEPLVTRNPPIGTMPGVAFRTAETEVPEGARLLLFSDGAFETTTGDGRIRGLSDFLPVLGRPPSPGVAEVDRLLEAAREGARPGPFDDDVCILCLEIA